jgi:hypothetical protein
MSYSPEYLTQRRAQRMRRRRALTVGAVVLAVCVVGVAVYAIAAPSKHVVVVRVARKAPATAGASATSAGGNGGQAEYPAAAGAESLQSVQAQLHAMHGQQATGAGDGAAEASSAASGGLLTSGSASSFQRLASSLPGRVELALAPLGAGRREVLGGDEPAHGWSTTKVPVLTALLRARGSGGLTAQERAWAQSAITESNNESVLALFGDLERLKGGLGGASRYMEGLLRRSGDSETVVATAAPPAGAVTTFGQTEWRPGEAVKFFRALALGCLLPASQTSYVLGLMESIEPGESWGLGSAGFDSVAFKGGWGPEQSGYLVRQSGIVDPGTARGAAVAIVAFAPSFGAGTEMLTRTASWLHTHLRLSTRPSAGCVSE